MWCCARLGSAGRVLNQSTVGFNRRKMVVFIKEKVIKVRKAKGANRLAVNAGSFLAKENPVTTAQGYSLHTIGVTVKLL